MQHIFYISASGFLHLCFFVWLSFWICLFRSFWCSLMCTYFWEFGSEILHIFVWILLIPFLSFAPFISEPIFISFRLSVWLSFIFISLSIFSTYKRRFFQLSSSSYEDERDCPILWRELQRRFFDYFLLNLLSGFQTEPMDERTYTNCKVYAYKSFENILYLQLK